MAAGKKMATRCLPDSNGGWGRRGQTSSNLGTQLKAFGKLKRKKIKKQPQVQEGMEEEKLTSASNDEEPAAKSELQGG
jgi:hypothetical protein